MGNLNVALVGTPGYGKMIGKQGTVSDLTYYNLKQGEDTVTMLEPHTYPDKLSPLFFSLAMSRYAILVADTLDAALGETILAIDAVGIGAGTIVLRNYLTPDQLASLVEGTVLEDFEIVTNTPETPLRLREQLLERATRLDDAVPESLDDVTGAVAIDQHFTVKGVGCVILGTVVRGRINRHDKLTALPTARIAQVRSIQKHDDDYQSATFGDRVGLALKSVSADELDRGYVLSNAPLTVAETITVEIAPNKFWKTPLATDAVVHIGHWMQFVPARITNSDEADGVYRLTLDLDKPLVLDTDARIFVSHLDAGKLRVAGSARLLSST